MISYALRLELHAQKGSTCGDAWEEKDKKKSTLRDDCNAESASNVKANAEIQIQIENTIVS